MEVSNHALIRASIYKVVQFSLMMLGSLRARTEKTFNQEGRLIGQKDKGNWECWWKLKIGQIKTRHGIAGLDDDENTLKWVKKSEIKGGGILVKTKFPNPRFQDSRVQGEYGNRYLITLATCICPSPTHYPHCPKPDISKLKVWSYLPTLMPQSVRWTPSKASSRQGDQLGALRPPRRAG